MGALLVSGLTLAGAAIGIALIAANARDGSGPDAALARATAILGVAFAQGLGVLGAVVGLLAITVRDAGDTSSGIGVALIAGAGAVVGLAVVARGGGGGRTIRALGLMYVISNMLLGIVVGILAATLGGGHGVGLDAVFVVLGLIAFGAAIMIGRTAATALRAMSTAPSDAVEIRRRFIAAVVVPEGLGALAMAAAIALLFVGSGTSPGS
jgi:F0F1-type ATP synthase membrane subunit c/vacuolar-type H+-ATPase subunit K